MANYRIRMRDKSISEIDGEGFTIIIAGHLTALFAHKCSPFGTTGYKVSHVDTGLGFCEIGVVEMRLAAGDIREAGRLAAFRRVENAGGFNCLKAIAEAAPLPPR